jgi:hypothetical protein
MRQVTREQSRDTGMAMVLLVLLLWLAYGGDGLVRTAVALLVLTMAVPGAFAPVAVVWLALSNAVGTVVSKALFSVVFVLVVTPIGVVRRWLGKDSLQLCNFKTSHDSVMVRRNHLYTPADLERPY